jgi:hypothetical protein
MPRAKSDPLIAALIAMLPPAGTDWPVDRQLAWLKLMAHALGAKYGGEVMFGGEAGGSMAKATQPGNVEPFRSRPAHQFVVDADGFARNEAGERILPDEVESYLYDTRGDDADMSAIVWADDSTGITGLDLTISAA